MDEGEWEKAPEYSESISKIGGGCEVIFEEEGAD